MENHDNAQNSEERNSMHPWHLCIDPSWNAQNNRCPLKFCILSLNNKSSSCNLCKTATQEGRPFKIYCYKEAQCTETLSMKGLLRLIQHTFPASTERGNWRSRDTSAERNACQPARHWSCMFFFLIVLASRSECFLPPAQCCLDGWMDGSMQRVVLYCMHNTS